MAKKTKSISFDEQLERMNELHGVPVEDALNVFSNFKKTVETMIGESADAKLDSFEFETPIGCIGFTQVDESERIDSATGTKFTAPAHYVGNYAFPVTFTSMANKNVDFSAVPTSSEIVRAKLKVA